MNRLFSNLAKILFLFSLVLPNILKSFTAPEGFERINGWGKHISVGKKTDGSMDVWVVGDDNKLYRYNSSKDSSNPWDQPSELYVNDTLAFKFVSVGEDGTVIATTTDGKAIYKYNGTNKFELISGWVSPYGDVKNAISVVDKDNIWDVGWETGVWRYAAGNWNRLGTFIKVVDISVGIDKIPFIVTSDGKNWRWISNGWRELNSKYSQISAINSTSAWAVRTYLYKVTNISGDGKVSEEMVGVSGTNGTIPTYVSVNSNGNVWLLSNEKAPNTSSYYIYTNYKPSVVSEDTTVQADTTTQTVITGASATISAKYCAPVWNDSWVLPQENKGLIKFKVDGPEAIVLLSPEKYNIAVNSGTNSQGVGGSESEPAYTLVIAGWDGTRTALRSQSGNTKTSSELVAKETTKGDFIGDLSKEFEVEINKTSAGKTRLILRQGDQVIIDYTDPDSAAKGLSSIKYLGFSSWSASATKYTNISISTIVGVTNEETVVQADTTIKTVFAEGSVTIPARYAAPVWNDVWVLPQENKGLVKFKVDGSEGVVLLSPEKYNVAVNSGMNKQGGYGAESKPAYTFVITGWGKTRTVLRSQSGNTKTSSELVAKETAKGDFIGDLSKEFEIEINKTSDGKTRLILRQGTQVIIDYTDPDSAAKGLSNVKYLGFSSWDASETKYTNISISSIADTTIVDTTTKTGPKRGKRQTTVPLGAKTYRGIRWEFVNTKDASSQADIYYNDSLKIRAANSDINLDDLSFNIKRIKYVNNLPVEDETATGVVQTGASIVLLSGNKALTAGDSSRSWDIYYSTEGLKKSSVFKIFKLNTDGTINTTSNLSIRYGEAIVLESSLNYFVIADLSDSELKKISSDIKVLPPLGIKKTTTSKTSAKLLARYCSPVWNNAWALPSTNNGLVKFNINGPEGIVLLSPQKYSISVKTTGNGSASKAAYTFVIRGWNGTRTVLRSQSGNTTTSSELVAKESTKGDFIGDLSKEFEISISETSDGKTRLILKQGTVTIIDYIDSDSAAKGLGNVKYIGFSSWATPIEYSNIAITSSAEAEAEETSAVVEITANKIKELTSKIYTIDSDDTTQVEALVGDISSIVNSANELLLSGETVALLPQIELLISNFSYYFPNKSEQVTKWKEALKTDVVSYKSKVDDLRKEFGLVIQVPNDTNKQKLIKDIGTLASKIEASLKSTDKKEVKGVKDFTALLTGVKALLPDFTTQIDAAAKKVGTVTTVTTTTTATTTAATTTPVTTTPVTTTPAATTTTVRKVGR